MVHVYHTFTGVSDADYAMHQFSHLVAAFANLMVVHSRELKAGTIHFAIAQRLNGTKLPAADTAHKTAQLTLEPCFAGLLLRSMPPRCHTQAASPPPQPHQHCS